jgi:hypothetical protein
MSMNAAEFDAFLRDVARTARRPQAGIRAAGWGARPQGSDRRFRDAQGGSRHTMPRRRPLAMSRRCRRESPHRVEVDGFTAHAQRASDAIRSPIPPRDRDLGAITVSIAAPAKGGGRGGDARTRDPK